MSKVELNPGEVKISFDGPKTGKVSFTDLGLKSEDLFFENGLLRLVLDLENVGEHQYFQVPTVEVWYKENMSATHWQCDFNDETILDKIDNHGHSTILLMDRKKISSLEHHHKNALIIHAEFPEAVHIDAEKSFINIFK